MDVLFIHSYTCTFKYALNPSCLHSPAHLVSATLSIDCCAFVLREQLRGGLGPRSPSHMNLRRQGSSATDQHRKSGCAPRALPADGVVSSVLPSRTSHQGYLHLLRKGYEGLDSGAVVCSAPVPAASERGGHKALRVSDGRRCINWCSPQPPFHVPAVLPSLQSSPSSETTLL